MMARRLTVTDEIYRAAIETAGHLGAPVEVGAAVRALAYELELRGLTVTMGVPGESEAHARTLVVGGDNGICVDDDADAVADQDFGDLLRRHHWRHAHAVVFGPDRLQIKSVAA
jgi:electron transfer flavoprotein alpha/beta subunit